MAGARAVVCGTTFGQVYLEAFRNPGLPELGGILANGSDRSLACARHYGVPLFTSPEDLPGDIGLACVVVRGGLLGGRGTELAERLMGRGIHVLQEHPVHHDELSGCLRTARRAGVHYCLNSFYPQLEPVRRFAEAARELLRHHEPRYLDAACGFQVGYALLDILAGVLGRTTPWRYTGVAATGGPFRSLDGMFGGVPCTLRIQHQIRPDDPDDIAHILHRVTIGTDSGDLTLVTTHGPVVWSARPRIPRSVRDPGSAPLFGGTGDTGVTDEVSARVLGPSRAPDYDTIFRSIWPQGVATAIREFCAAADEGTDPLRLGGRHLALCRMWQDIADRLGPPELVTG